MDSNHDKELQRLLCYHYTTGQGSWKVAFQLCWCKQIPPRPYGRFPLLIGSFNGSLPRRFSGCYMEEDVDANA